MDVPCRFKGRSDRMRLVKITISATMAFALAVAMAGPAAAYQVISEVGPHGHYDITDTIGTPGAKCSYGPQVYTNWAYLKSMKVYAPHVFAADRNSEKRDHRTVSWQFKLQRQSAGESAWHTFKSSAKQTKVAYEDTMAPFTAMTITYNSENSDPDHVSGPNLYYRALVIIKWYKPDGSVESTVKLVPDYYAMDTCWDEAPNQGKCSRVDTNG
jgi:hypothetical protein